MNLCVFSELCQRLFFVFVKYSLKLDVAFSDKDTINANKGLSKSEMTYLIATVAVKRPFYKFYNYLVPEELKAIVRLGSIIRIPIRNQVARGCIVALQETNDIHATEKLRAVIESVTPDYHISENLIKLGKWMTEYYISFPGNVFSCVSFIGFNEVSAKKTLLYRLKDAKKIEETLESASEDEDEFGLLRRCGFTVKQLTVIETLLENGNEAVSRDELAEESGVKDGVIAKLIEKGILEKVEEEVYRADPYEMPSQSSSPLVFNEYQQKAFNKIEEAISAERSETFLLFGVTGSGKTEIYLQAIDLCLKMGKQCVVLIPEISLTPQTVERFRARFGDTIGVYHSKISLGMKYDLYRRIKRGEVSVVIGARSALFTPFDRLGLVIVDEEHESSFKQDCDPRYQSRDVAVMRGHLEKAAVILGSATPSLESYNNALKGKYTMLKLPERVENFPMPPISIVDMASVISSDASADDMLSPEMAREISDTFLRKEQIILFINRRGFFNFQTCMKCRFTRKCEQCDISLTYHKAQNKLTCHLCGKKYEVSDVCPKCASNSMALIGAGIQRAEEEIKKRFPDARVLRIDLDTTSSRLAFVEKWKMIVNHEADIILGTQMVAKGFHLEKVTLVGVVMADIGLHQPDFRATERTFSLLMQVAGRTGRSLRGGRVVIQTYHPEHYVFSYVKNHNYVDFAQRELKFRSLMQFPPIYKLVSIVVSGKDASLVKNTSERIARFIRSLFYKYQEKAVYLIGPAQAPISRIRGSYRQRLLLRSKDHQSIKKYIDIFQDEFETWKLKSRIRLIFDVDPFDLL